jgi:hypothetical protein
MATTRFLLALSLAAAAVTAACWKPASARADSVRTAAAAPTKAVNEELAKAWAANKLTPSPVAKDTEFVRRVFLDLIGRIPRPDEVRSFVQAGANRPALVRKLLYDNGYADEYARHMANQWTVWLLTRSANATHQEQLRDWLRERFTENASYKSIVAELITATGKTNENGAVNFILGNLGDPVSRDKRTAEGHFDVVPVTSRTTRLFLGRQVQCVQCHDHPFNPDWKQQEFWGVNAFYRQVKRDGAPVVARPIMNRDAAAILTLGDDPKVNPDGLVNYERRNGMVMPASMMFIGGSRPAAEANEPRRAVLARLLTGHPDFPKAVVNRVWGQLFGRGLNEQPAVDDFGEHNPLVHPQLLTRLADAFADVGYDLKLLYTWICTSDAYGLTSSTNVTNGKPETDVFFSRMLLKALTPEQMLESLWVATRGKSDAADAPAARDRRRAWTASLVRNFGDDEGNEVTFNGTVVQALLMMNGREINAEILSPDGTVVGAIKKHKNGFGSVVGDVYMAALSRRPTDAEMAAVRRVADKWHGRVDASFHADLMWALLNSNEFILNH